MASHQANGVNGVNGIPQVNGVPHEPDEARSKSQSGNPTSYSAKFNLAGHFIGANHLDVAPAGRVKDFVLQNDGHTVITNVSPIADPDSFGNFLAEKNVCTRSS